MPQGNWFSQQLQLVKAAVKAWSDDYAPSMGAALSYYTLFSIAPLLIVVIAVAGMVFGQEAAQGAIVGQLRGIMGEEGAVAVEGMLKAAREPAKSMVATIAGIATLLLGSTAIFARAAKRAGPHLASAGGEEGVWDLAPVAQAPAVIRPRARPGLPADRIARRERGARGPGQVVGRLVRRLGCIPRNPQLRGFVRHLHSCFSR